MSFSSSPPPTFDDAARDNLRVLLFGVDAYTNFPDNAVKSATNNVMAWLLQAMRMGVSPVGNAVALGRPAAEVQASAREVIATADLARPVRDAASQLIATWLSGRDALLPPTFASLLRGVITLGNHLNYSATTRMLFVFSGHGALSQGRFVLCPSDAEEAKAARPTKKLQGDLERLTARLTQALAGSTEAGANAKRVAEVVATMRRMGEDALAKGVLAELVDVLAVPVGDIEVRRWPTFASLAMIEFVGKNLERVPEQPTRPSPLTFANVVNPIHLMLCLGATDSRVTMVLDACHSGGLGTSLQGSEVAHDWTDLGLRCRILSSGHKTQRSAESSFGERRYAAATWALTRVLSRWENVKDGPAYAMGITNGNLVLRANMLLDALSFNQQISLSAPAPTTPADRSAADMPFMGIDPATRTYVDPNVEAGGIQLSSGSENITIWKVLQGGTLKAALMAVGAAAGDWTYAGKTYQQGKLYLFTTPLNVGALAGQSFSMDMVVWHKTADPIPQGFAGPLDAFGNKANTVVSAWGDGQEVAYNGNGPAASGNYASFQGMGKTVWMKWVAPGPGAPPTPPARLIFVGGAIADGPYMPADFAAQSSFTVPNPQPSFTTSNWMHIIDLPPA
jgi:hypothetical protein